MVVLIKEIAQVNISPTGVVMGVRRKGMPLGEKIFLTTSEWKDIGSPLPGDVISFTIEVKADV